jgi:integration host factor subunit alpha
MGTMTKKDIIQKIHTKLGYSKKDSAILVEQIFEIMKEDLAHGGKIKISGFGSFTVKDKKAQKGRNPQTGEEIEIGARKVLTFKPSQILRRDLNS